MRFFKTLVTFSLAFLLSLSTVADDKVVRLTSLDWPPYTGKSLPQQGASVVVAKKAFEAMGYTLEVDFYPWSRTVYLAKQPDSNYIGYFPEYYAEELEKEFYFSDSMGTGPLGLAQLKSKPVTWSEMADLTQYKIGVVKDYVNTAEFDKMVADGKIDVEPVASDTLNLRKLAAGRIDAVVLDSNVMNYWLVNDASLQPHKDKIEFNAKPLENKQLYVCFKKTPEGKRLQEIFNEGLTKIDVDQIMADYMSGL